MRRIIFFFLAGFGVSVQSHAAAVNFVPTLGVGKNTLEFTQKLPTGERIEESADFIIASVGGAWAIDRFFFNAVMDIPFNDDQFYRDNPLPTVNGVTQVSREDYNFALGYAVLDWMTLFAGYSIGDTEFSSTTLSSWGYIAEHDDSGLFAGINVSTAIGNAGSIGFDLAYADFDGEITTRTPDPALTAFNHRTVSGDTTGLSYGVQWTAPASASANYFVRIRIRDYQFDAEKANTNPQPNGLEIDKYFTMMIVGASF